MEFDKEKEISELKDRQKIYLKTKKEIAKHVKYLFDPEVNNYLYRDTAKRLFELGKKDGLIEIGFAYGDGDYYGTGYFKVHLMLNLNRITQADFLNSIYIMVRHVSRPDEGEDWLDNEFDKVEEIYFSPSYVLLGYMRCLTKQVRFIIEMSRLSQREYPTCVGNTTITFS